MLNALLKCVICAYNQDQINWQYWYSERAIAASSMTTFSEQHSECVCRLPVTAPASV